MKDHLVVIYGMMVFLNHRLHGKDIKHYIFGPLNSSSDF